MPDLALLRPLLPDTPIQAPAETASTNTDARRWLQEGAVHGSLVAADRQTAGRGRLGRSFASADGGLYMSVVIKSDLPAGVLTTLCAVAVRRAIRELTGKTADIKWVNDLYLNGKKIVGILTEASMDMEMRALDMAVIGIGINVRSVKGCFDDELSQRASSIEDETGEVVDRNALCAEVINSLDSYLSKIENRSYLREYRERELLSGNFITAKVGNEIITGKALGIDRNANLMVETESGIVRSLSSGEANLCRIKE